MLGEKLWGWQLPFESSDDQPFDEGNDNEGESPHAHPFPRQVMESLISPTESIQK